MNNDFLFKSNSETGSFQVERLARPSDLLDDKAEWVRWLRCTACHVHAIATMIESGADCQSVLQQIIAVQAALGEVTGLLVRRHLTVCLGELKGNANIDARTREQYLAEILSLYQRCGKALQLSNRKELL